MPLMPDPADWSYSQDPSSSDLDAVRFWVQDTDPDVRLLSNSDILWLIGQWKPKYDSLPYVAAKAAEVIATKFAGVVNVSADGVSVNVADLSARYAEAARRLYQVHKDYQVGAELDLSNLMWGARPDFGIAPLTFGMGLHDNREAGRQDYGGETINPWQQAEEIVRGY